MAYLKNFVKHFRTVCRHKLAVCKICFKFGLYWQGLVHDNSKFSPKEFLTSVKYYQGGSSPIDAEKEDKGYSLAWAHHHNKNPHHWLYWVDFDRENNITPMKIPYKYALEAICDWIGAGQTYCRNSGTLFTWSEPYTYYKKNTKINSETNIHPTTIQFWDTILVDLMLEGINTVVELEKSGKYKEIYNADENSEIGYKSQKYKDLISKYYK